MKKVYGAIAVGLVSTMLMAGSAGAAATIGSSTGMTISAAFDDVVIAEEMSSATLSLAKDFETGDVGDGTTVDAYIAGGTARDVFYMADLGLNTDWTARFTLSNATFTSATLALVADEASGSCADLNSDLDSTDIVKVGQLISGGNGESTVTFIITGTDVPADCPLMISDSDAAQTSFSLESTATSGTISLSCDEVKSDGGTNIDAAETTAATLITLEQQIAMTVSTAATSVIDVETDRLEFVDETAGADDAEQTGGAGDTDPGKSAATLTIDNDSDSTVDDAITLDVSDTVTVSLTPSTDATGVDGAFYNSSDQVGATAAAMTATQELTGSPLSVTLTLNAGGADDATNIACAQGAADDKQLVVFVDGTTTLDTRTFNTTASIDFSDEPGDATLINDQLSHTWTMNGWQGTIPYLYAASDASEDTFFKIYNDNSVAADVTIDVTNDDGTVTASVDLTQIPANNVGIFWANDIATSAGLTVPGAFAGKLTVNAATAGISVMANQKRPGGVDRVIPVYTTDADDYNRY